MRGSIRAKKPGSWELVFDAGRDPLTGRRQQRSQMFHGTKRDAERELRRLVRDAEEGRLVGGGVLMSDLLAGWLDLCADNLSPTTMREYRRLVDKRIVPAIGAVAVTKLTTRVLDDYYLALSREAGLSAASVRQVHSVIRRALRQGVRWGWIEHNVAISATKPRLGRSKISPPSIGRVHELLAEADRHDPSFGVLVRVAIATGMRRGELCGLRWCDTDLDRRHLNVAQAIVAVPNGTAAKTPKSGATRRLAIDPATAAILDNHLNAMQQRAQDSGNRLADDAYVFTHTLDGSRPLHPDNVTAAFRRLPSNKGTVRLHDLRHAHATQLLSNGVDISAVSSRLGHANPSTTLNIYAHALEETDERAATVIGALLA